MKKAKKKSSPTSSSNSGHDERPRYFPRQLLDAQDFTDEQEYHREARRRHNRMLHGWGIVNGIELHVGKSPWTIVVEPGYALSPLGDEIVLHCAETVDVRQHAKRKGQTYFVTARYQQIATRLLPVLVEGETREAYSRWRDGFEIGVLVDPDGQGWIVLGSFVVDSDGKISLRKNLRRRLKRD